MKKRIFVFLSLLTLVFALSSCGDEEKINGAIAKTKELEYIDADVYLDINMEADYNSRHFREIKHIVKSKDDKGEVIVSQENQTYGREEKSVTYFDSEYAYLPNGTKMPIDLYKAYNTDYGKLVTQLLSPFPQSVIEKDENGVRFIATNDVGGDLTVSLKVNSNDKESDIKIKRDALNGMFSLMTNDAISRVKRYLFCDKCQMQKDECPNCSANEFEDCKNCTVIMEMCQFCQIKSVEIESNSVDLKIKDGYVTELEANLNMCIRTGDGSVTADTRIKIVINNPGEKVNVELPSGYASFEEKKPQKRPTLKDLVK